jgi:DNA repair protein RecN (Recombination protein N)
MLRELHISNLAVIADARIELNARLNCFTGATGAGKSLVIGALELLLGLRSPAEMLRPGAEEARVSGVFDGIGRPILQQIERITDVAVAADGELLLTRRLYASGRSGISLNGNPITLSMLRELSEVLVDVHGQHDHQYLLKPANQLEVIDQYAGLTELRSKYRATYQQLSQARSDIEKLSTSRTLRRQQLELYRFQAAEIDAAELRPAEYEELQSRASVLENLEKLKKDAGSVHAALYEADGSVMERLKMIAGVLSELGELDFNLKPLAQAVRNATLELEDSAFDLSRYLDKLDLDPTELVTVSDRLNTINRLLNKYGDPVTVTLAYRAELAEKITDLERADDVLENLDARIAPLAAELSTTGDALSRGRAAAAAQLAPLIERQLSELGMEKAKFAIAISACAEPLASGMDSIEFILQTNPGLAPQPLRKIASGGEMSRIMLALKGVLAGGDRVSVLVFDEIDANVGGRLGSIIGEKLRGLSTHHQVICITHLPQIASFADRHLTVRKQVVGNETRTTVRPMDGPERLEELAEMIGGKHITDVTRAQARELLEAATPQKEARRSPRGARARNEHVRG